MDDYEISASDEEWETYKLPTDPPLDFPMRLLPLFKEIDEKKILNLTCVCPRRGNIKDIQSSPTTSSSSVVSPTQPSPIEVKKDSKEIINQNKTFEAFDFDNGDGNEKPSAKRQKTPASTKREKKVASMSNVMSDLLRSKLLDELEASKNDDTEQAVKK